MRGDQEWCRFGGLTSYGKIWKNIPEVKALSVGGHMRRVNEFSVSSVT